MNISNKLNTNSSSSEITNIRHPEYSNTNNHIRKLNIENNKQIHIVFSENDSKISSRLVTEDGESVIITTENCPIELSKIKNLETLDKFLENAFAKVSNLSDGTLKLYIVQKCVGGSQIKPTGSLDAGIGKNSAAGNTSFGVGISNNHGNASFTVNHGVYQNGMKNYTSKPTFSISGKFKF